MNIRRATLADEAILRGFFQEFESEVPTPVGDPETWDEEWKELYGPTSLGFLFSTAMEGSECGGTPRKSITQAASCLQ